MSSTENARTVYQSLTERLHSVILATVSQTGVPHASYAPFVSDEAKNVYIFVSGLATHTSNLQATERASLLFIEDESNSPQIFGRTRLTLDCTVSTLGRNTFEWSLITDKFKERFGDIVDVISSLGDFSLFKLTPQEGQLVLGFGQAYRVGGEKLDTLTLITGR